MRQGSWSAQREPQIQPDRVSDDRERKAMTGEGGRHEADPTSGGCFRDSAFTCVTAHWIAQPPEAAFVAGLQPSRLPDQTARQLPDQTDNYLGGTLLHS